VRQQGPSGAQATLRFNSWLWCSSPGFSSQGYCSSFNVLLPLYSNGSSTEQGSSNGCQVHRRLSVPIRTMHSWPTYHHLKLGPLTHAVSWRQASHLISTASNHHRFNVRFHHCNHSSFYQPFVLWCILSCITYKYPSCTSELIWWLKFISEQTSSPNKKAFLHACEDASTDFPCFHELNNPPLPIC